MERYRGNITLAIISLIIIISLQTTSYANNRYALAIGVSKFENNRYPKNSANNDVDAITSTLTDSRSPGNIWKISTLRDDEATISKVTTMLDSIASLLQPGDQFILYFAGHGSRVADENGDEDDQFDEGIVLYDEILIDDKLDRYITEYRETVGDGGEVVILIDACFSGTIEKGTGAGICRGVDDYVIDPEHIWSDKDLVVDNQLSQDPKLSSLYVITASKANKMAYEIDNPLYIDGMNRYYGVLTISLCDVFNLTSQKDISFKQFQTLLQQAMKQNRDDASPYIYISGNSSRCRWIKI